MPAPPPADAIKAEWKRLISNGEILLGQTCTSPYTLHKFVTKDGKIVAKEVKISGRKIPIEELRVRQKQEKHMYLFTDDRIDSMEHKALLDMVKQYVPNVSEATCIAALQEMLKKLQCTRSLAIWHDHATVLGNGYIMIAIYTSMTQLCMWQKKRCQPCNTDNHRTARNISISTELIQHSRPSCNYPR